jgi:hypothetical protein
MNSSTLSTSGLAGGENNSLSVAIFHQFATKVPLTIYKCPNARIRIPMPVHPVFLLTIYYTHFVTQSSCSLTSEDKVTSTLENEINLKKNVKGSKLAWEKREK